MALLPHVQLAEAVKPESHKLRADLGLCQLFAGKPVLKLVAAVFQLLQPLLCGACQDALLNGVEQIADGGFRFTELLLIQRHVHIVPVLQVHQHGHDGFYRFVVHDHFHGFTDHQILDPFFPDGSLVALGALLFDGHTLVVVMHFSRAACAALAAEVGPAVAAEQLGGQQIIVLGLVTRRGLFVLRQLLLHPVKEVLRYDCGDAVRHDHIAVSELPDISPVVEYMPHAVEGHFLPPRVGEPLLVQPIHNGGNGFSAVISLEGFQHEWRGQRVDLEVLLRVDHITYGHHAAVEFALEGVVRHAANDLFGEVSGVVFRIAFEDGFENDAFRAL